MLFEGSAEAKPSDAAMELLTLGVVKLQESCTFEPGPESSLRIAAPLLATALIREYLVGSSLEGAPQPPPDVGNNAR